MSEPSCPHRPERPGEHEAADLVRNLLSRHGLAVLATQGPDGPYTSLVGIACDGRLRRFYLSAQRASRKLSHILAHPRVCLLMDSRSGDDQADFQAAVAVSAWGEAHVVAPAEDEAARAALRGRHPGLGAFLDDPQTVMVAVEVLGYQVVDHLCDVRRFEP